MNSAQGPIFFDAHNHLQDERFAGRQAELVAAARAAGVARMVVNGSCEADWPLVRDLALRFPDRVLPSYGYHPWYLGERSPRWLDRLREFLDETPCAVGEIGLDRWKTNLPWDGQPEAFRLQLELAAGRNLPASIHVLKAWGPALESLRAGPRPARGFLLHSYGGARELIEPLAELGAYFSLPGYFARPGKEHKADVFRHVPPERLLIETDAPDQSLPDHRNTHALAGGLNHPANLPAIYAFAAEWLGRPVGELAAQVAANFRRLFGESP